MRSYFRLLARCSACQGSVSDISTGCRPLTAWPSQRPPRRKVPMLAGDCRSDGGAVLCRITPRRQASGLSRSLKTFTCNNPRCSPHDRTGKEAAAEALGALVWVSFADPGQRDEMRGQVLPALLHMLGATHHDGCRIAALAALRTMAASPGTSDFRCEGTRSSRLPNTYVKLVILTPAPSCTLHGCRTACSTVHSDEALHSMSICNVPDKR